MLRKKKKKIWQKENVNESCRIITRFIFRNQDSLDNLDRPIFELFGRILFFSLLSGPVKDADHRSEEEEWVRASVVLLRCHDLRVR